MVNGSTLVTGATGGLGRILVERLLAEGRAVRASGRNTGIGRLLETAGARFVAADLARDDLAPLVQGVSTVFHLAALSSPWGPEADFVAANVNATMRLLAAARGADVRIFMLTSTPSIYARAKDQIALHERSALPRRLANAYARTKLAAERHTRGADGAAMRTVTLRPRAIIGPYDAVLLPRLLRAAETGVMPLPRGGCALIEPTDARDVVAALLAAEARAGAIGGQVFNISGGQAVTLAALVSHVFDRLGRKVRLVSVPAHVALAAGGLLEVMAKLRRASSEPLLTRYTAMTLGWSQTFDLSAAREASVGCLATIPSMQSTGR